MAERPLKWTGGGGFNSGAKGFIYNFKYDAWEKLDKTNNFKTCITG